MSNRSLLEFSHDYCPGDDAECLALGRALQAYMRAAYPDELPRGVTRKHYRHHSDPCPIEQMGEFAHARAMVSQEKPRRLFRSMRDEAALRPAGADPRVRLIYIVARAMTLLRLPPNELREALSDEPPATRQPQGRASRNGRPA